MGKYKHEGQGRNISISGGQQRKDLFKDMSGGYNAMGDSNQPLYKYNGSVAQQRYSSPAELTTEGKEKILASDANDAFKSAIAKQPLDMKGSTSPTYKTGCTSGSGSQAPYQMMGDPNKKMDRLSAKHKSLYDRFEMGQTSEKEEQKMFRLEDRMDKVGARINKKSSPATMVKKVVKPKFKKVTELQPPIPDNVKSPLNNGGTRNSGDAPRKMSPEEKAKLRAENRARIDKRDAMIAKKKAQGVYPKDK